MAAEQAGHAGQTVGQAGRAGSTGAPVTQARIPQTPPSFWPLRLRLNSSLLCDVRIWQVLLTIVACVLFGMLMEEYEPTAAPEPESSASAAPQAATPRVCERLGCVVTAAQTVRFVNRSVDPCSDFFHFACGRFDEAHPSGTRSAFGVRDVLQRRNRARLLQLLSQRQLYNSSSAVSKARLFFSTCTQAFSASLNGVPALVSLLQPLGGLDLLNTWRPNQWDFNVVLSNASRLHLTQAFFTLTWHRWNGVLEVQLPKLALDFTHWDADNGRYHAVEARVGRAMREVFHQLEQDSGVLLRNREADDAKTPRACSLDRSSNSTNNLISPCVEEIVRDILSVQGELFGIEAQRTSQTPYRPPETVSMVEMIQLVPQIDWRQLLDALFGDGAVPGSVRFQVPSREHMAAVGRIIENTRVKRLHHFLMWSVIRRYLVAAGPVYATLGEELDRNYDAERLKTREEQCLELLDEHMAPALHALLLSIHIGHDSSPHVRKHLINDAISVLNDSFGRMSEATQQKSRAALDNLQVRYGFTVLLRFEGALDKYYSSINFHVLNFFNNLRALYQFNRPGDIRGQLPTKAPPESVKIRHNFALGTLWIPFGALQAPWYHVDVPAPLNAASLGSLIFEALAVPFIRIHLSPQNLTDIWDRETESRFEHYYNCLLNKVRRRPIRQDLTVLEPGRSGLRFAAYGMRVDPVPATYYMMADQFAYELSYRLYQRLAANDTEPVVLPGLPITNSSQAFFLAFAQARCRNDYALWDEPLIGASKTLQVPESYVINQLVLDDARFREAFQCGPLPDEGVDSENRQCSLF